MATLNETLAVDAPDDLDDLDEAMARLSEFYLANGYLPENATPTDAPSLARDGAYIFTRGKPGNGWWTSDMSELFTRVRIESLEGELRLDYEVETTGQWLSEADRTFWSRERQAAVNFMTGVAHQPLDLRPIEEMRSKKVSRGFLSVGLTGAFAVFIVIILLGFFGII